MTTSWYRVFWSSVVRMSAYVVACRLDTGTVCSTGLVLQLAGGSCAEVPAGNGDARWLESRRKVGVVRFLSQGWSQLFHREEPQQEQAAPMEMTTRRSRVRSAKS